MHHRQDLGVEAHAQRVLADHVDVALVELAETAALGALAAVHPLHLVAPEREGGVVFVFGDVARQRHGEVETQRQLRQGRSEEHTSELQSLMRISYAVFCLKKKKITS